MNDKDPQYYSYEDYDYYQTCDRCNKPCHNNTSFKGPNDEALCVDCYSSARYIVV